jgi:CheY-like chemotaxis protein
MNGPEATRIIREMGFDGSIFGVTGNVLAEDVTMFESHGGDAVIAKPVQYKMIDECWDRFGGNYNETIKQRK